MIFWSFRGWNPIFWPINLNLQISPQNWDCSRYYRKYIFSWWNFWDYIGLSARLRHLLWFSANSGDKILFSAYSAKKYFLVSKPVSAKLDSSVKISKYLNYKKPPHNYNFEGKKYIQPGETPWQTAMKKMWLPRQNGHGCKKTKKAVSKHENLWQFLKIGNTFLKSHFFCKWKKKVDFRDKKNKNYATIWTQIFQKHLSTVDFLNFNWNFSLF